ncbi:hypothetical protein [Nocardia puris]|nr:hypothetical protein [Nocardia puris]
MSALMRDDAAHARQYASTAATSGRTNVIGAGAHRGATPTRR